MTSECSFVFIGGYMHSGTTLLGQLIEGLPGAYRPSHETKFLEFLPRYRSLYPDLLVPEVERDFRELCRRLLRDRFRIEELAGTGPAPKDHRTSGPTEHLAIYLEEARSLLDDEGCRTLVEHTGTNIFGYGDLATCGERTYLVEIVRDPRDVLASKKTRRATVFTDRYRPEEQRRKHFEKSFDAVWDTLSWRTFVRSGDAAATALPDRHLRIRYEDLVVDPMRELGRVGALLGLDQEVGISAVTVNNPADPSVARVGIDGQSIGRWRGTLTAGEASIGAWLARRELHGLGYEDTVPLPGIEALAPLAGSLVEPPVRLYRRFRLGGFAAARSIGANYVRRAARTR